MHCFSRSTRTDRLRKSVIILTAALVITGCNRSLESVTVRIDKRDDSRRMELKVSDLGRRDYESEALVIPIDPESERPFRYRIESTDDTEVPLETDRPGMIVTVSGEVTGGKVAFFTPSESVRYRFDEIIKDDRTRGERRYTFSVPIPSRGDMPWEVEFTAAAESQGFRVEEILFGERLVSIGIDTSAGTFRTDLSLPLYVTDETLEIRDIRSAIRDVSDALAIDYRAAMSLFDDRANRPILIATLNDSAGGRSLDAELRPRPGDRSVKIRPYMWFQDTRSVSLRIPEGVLVTGVSVYERPDEREIPIIAGLREILNWPRERWRRQDFEYFSWAPYPAVLWFDHRSYDTQSRMFKRLAFFAEKRGYRGRLLQDDQLQGLRGWNAHGYSTESLAAFYNAADVTDFPLNEMETALLAILLESGLLQENDFSGVGDAGLARGERLLPGRGGVLSISRESLADLRVLLAVNEAMHGVFYEEPAHRRTVFDYWDRVLSQRERDFWELYLSWAGYETDDRYLVVNQFQSQLLRRSEGAVNWYLGTRTVDRLRTDRRDRAESIDLLLRDYPAMFTRAAGALNESLYSVAGMVGGDPFDLRVGEVRR